MYKYIFLIIPFFIISCYKEDLPETQFRISENKISRDSLITQQVTDGKMPDYISTYGLTACYDIIFPVTISVNQKKYLVRSYEQYNILYDSLNSNDNIFNFDIELLFPYYVVDSSFTIHKVEENFKYDELKTSCSSFFSNLHHSIDNRTSVKYCYEYSPIYWIIWENGWFRYISGFYSGYGLDYQLNEFTRLFPLVSPIAKLRLPISIRKNESGTIVPITFDDYDDFRLLKQNCN